MAKTFDAIVRETLANQLITILSMQAQIEELTEQLAEAKKASDPKRNVSQILDAPLHEVGKR